MCTASRWRTVFWCTFALFTLIKLWLAATLSPFGDEAFYWQESRHLAWSYSDVPPLTAWLIAVGEAIFGHSPLAMRAPFLLIGACVPLLAVRFASQLFDERAGWQAGLWIVLMPLTGTLGVLALPDVPLTLATLLALVALERCARNGSMRDWIALGAALAFAWLAHYRAAMLMLTGLVFLLGTARGRTLSSHPGLWLALAIAALGVVPLVLFNAQHGWDALGFQMIDRHPWAFHADALLQPIEQAITVTPLLYLAMLVTLAACVRRAGGGAPWDVLAVAGLVPMLGYFVIGLFADAERFRVHWPLPAYLALAVALPAISRDWAASSLRNGRSIAVLLTAAAALALCAILIVFGYLAATTHVPSTTMLARYKMFPDNFVGWRESGHSVRELLANDPERRIELVADNFMLAAQLDFALDGTRTVYSLDSPLNAKHGRAAQLALWSRDERALRSAGERRVLLVVEETGLRERARVEWLQSLCTKIGDMQPVRRLDLFGGRKRMAFYDGVALSMTEGRAPCDYPPQAPFMGLPGQPIGAGGTQ
ncbi:MAG: glycosyltransferase family 39 protein [Dokdonella sp.]